MGTTMKIKSLETLPGKVMLSLSSENGGTEIHLDREETALINEENWKIHLEFINNFLIEQSYIAPFTASPNSLKNISIAYALVRRIIKANQLLAEYELRMKRTNFDLKNLQNLTSNYQTKVEQLQNDLASATITAKLSNESMAKLNSEFNSLTTDFNKTKNQAQNKEKLFLVELRKKEKEIGKIKSHLNLQLKGAYKQFDVNSFFMDPSVTNFTNSTGPALGNNELWREMVQRMEEKLQNNQISFSNLKGVLNNVYYSLGALAGINQEELLQPVELNSFNKSQCEVILISFQSIIEKIKTILFANASLSPQKDIQQEMKIMQLERHSTELQNSLRDVECQLENNKRLLQMSLTNETCTLDQERSELNSIRNELDIRSKRLEEDRKKLAELTIKFAQEKQLFLKEKFAFEQQKKSL